MVFHGALDQTLCPALFFVLGTNVNSELTNPMDSDNFLLKRRSILKNRIFLRMDLFCEFLWIGFDRYTLPNESESGNHGIMLTSECFYGGYYGFQGAHLYINCR